MTTVKIELSFIEKLWSFLIDVNDEGGQEYQSEGLEKLINELEGILELANSKALEE